MGRKVGIAVAVVVAALVAFFALGSGGGPEGADPAASSAGEGGEDGSTTSAPTVVDDETYFETLADRMVDAVAAFGVPAAGTEADCIRAGVPGLGDRATLEAAGLTYAALTGTGASALTSSETSESYFDLVLSCVDAETMVSNMFGGVGLPQSVVDCMVADGSAENLLRAWFAMSADPAAAEDGDLQSSLADIGAGCFTLGVGGDPAASGGGSPLGG